MGEKDANDMTDPQSGIRENKSLIEYLATRPLEQVVTILAQVQIDPSTIANNLKGEGVLAIEIDGSAVELEDWFVDNADKVEEMYSSVFALATKSAGLNDFDKGIVDDVVMNQTRVGAFYGMATMYAVTDAFRAAGVADMDRSQTQAPTVAYELQALYDVMPAELQDQTRTYLAKKYNF